MSSKEVKRPVEKVLDGEAEDRDLKGIRPEDLLKGSYEDTVGTFDKIEGVGREINYPRLLDFAKEERIKNEVKERMPNFGNEAPCEFSSCGETPTRLASKQMIRERIRRLDGSCRDTDAVQIKEILENGEQYGREPGKVDYENQKFYCPRHFYTPMNDLDLLVL